MSPAPKRVRWECPNGCAGVLGPIRPRRDDVRRYCLACSAKTGRLVERVSPALERQRAASAERSRAKAAKARDRKRAAAERRWGVGGTRDDDPRVDLVNVWAKALALPSLKPAARRARWGTLRRSSENPTQSSGRAAPWSGEVSLTLGVRVRSRDAVGVLLHELAHVACGASGEPYGDVAPEFGRRCLDAHDEWNARYGASVVEVDRLGRGAPYRGAAGRLVREKRDRRRATRPPITTEPESEAP